jgi:hypothetical protein
LASERHTAANNRQSVQFRYNIITVRNIIIIVVIVFIAGYLDLL